MSERVCYISRQDRGARIDGVRLVGAHSDDRWSAPGGSVLDPREPARRAAEWIRERLGATSKSRDVSTLCLDVDGGVCAWVSSPTPDATLIKASVEGARGAPRDDDMGEGFAGDGPAARFPDLPGETSYEPLAEAPQGGSGGVALLNGRKSGGKSGRKNAAPSAIGATRMAVLGVPDVPARLLLDELDGAGVRVGRAISLWHAAAQAWDPSGPASNAGRTESRTVADHAPVTAIVLLDPDSRRLVWAWSSKGTLISSGTMRLRRVQGDDDTGAPVVCAADLGRLTAEWLSWSIQLGHAPARVVWVGAVDGEAEDGLSAAGVGEALGSRWPDAAVDLIEEEDPIGVTLRRVVAAEDLGARPAPDAAPERSELSSLSRRPSKAHRAMHVWAALALVIAGAALGALAWRQWNSAGEADAALAQVRTDRRGELESADPALVMSPFPLNELRSMVQQETNRLSPTSGFTPPTPVLGQLEAFTLVLGTQQIHLTNIDITSLSVSIKVRVDDIALVEQIDQALRSVGDESWVWSDYQSRREGSGHVNATYNAVWRPR